MSFIALKSAFISGLNAKLVKVECDIGRGINTFNLIGLGDKAVEESKERISSALRNVGYSNPRQTNQKTTIALAPGDLKKEGTNFDLAIALAYLIANQEIVVDKEEVNDSLFVGELSLAGKLSNLKGALAIAELAKKNKIQNLFLPKQNALEASLVKGLNIYGVENLLELIDHLTASEKITKAKNLSLENLSKLSSLRDPSLDMQDIKGQSLAKRALLIAMSGGHNVALYGPPGTGKTMLAKAAQRLLPNLDRESILEVTKIYSIAGLNSSTNLILEPPFRSPHHTASYVSLVGGGSNLKPGEITLAHRGILFLDEFPEFEKKSLEALREPLEEGQITISRAKGTEKFPANFILIAAMNPCPCGHRGSKTKKCVCSMSDINKYERRLSGPIMDRIDIWVNVSNIPYTDLMGQESGEETSAIFQTKILQARAKMTQRFSKDKALKINNDMGVKAINQYLNLEPKIKKEFDLYATKLELSPRVYHKVLKVARTIADLENQENIQSEHILEALQYRPKINL